MPPSTAATSAVSTGETSSRIPAATPANATWPMPSPISDCRRWTRKNPTAGASTPTIAPAPSARRMNSLSSMDVCRVVPHAGQVAGRAVEDDRPAHEDEPLDEVLDRAELVRDVDDRDAEVSVERRPSSSASDSCDSASTPVVGSSSTSSEGCAGERLRDERALLHPAGERAQRRVGDGARARLGRSPPRRARDRRAASGPSRPPGRQPARRDDLAHGRRRVAAERAIAARGTRARAVARSDARARRRAAPTLRSAARARGRCARASSSRPRSGRRPRRTRPRRARGSTSSSTRCPGR